MCSINCNKQSLHVPHISQVQLFKIATYFQLKCNPFKFRDEESFFEAFLHELEKAEGLMEEMQVIGQEERSRIMRKGSVAEEDGLDLSGKIRKILTAIENEDEVEKSKIAKVFKEKTGLLTLGIKKGTLNKLLKGQNKPGISLPSGMFKATQKTFTLEDANDRTGKKNTRAFQCSLVRMQALDQETRLMAMEVLIPDNQKGTIIYDDDLEDLDEAGPGASQDFPEVAPGNGSHFICNYCDFTSDCEEVLKNHMEGHPKCNQCTRRFGTDADLMEHLPSHVMVKCSQCYKMIQKAALKKHKEEHATIEQFKKAVNKEKIKKVTSTKAKGKNPWMNFCKERRPIVKANHPLYTSAQVSEELSRTWRSMSTEEKAGYREISEEEEEIMDDDNAGAGGDVEAVVEVEVISWYFCQRAFFLSPKPISQPSFLYRQ